VTDVPVSFKNSNRKRLRCVGGWRVGTMPLIGAITSSRNRFLAIALSECGLNCHQKHRNKYTMEEEETVEAA